MPLNVWKKIEEIRQKPEQVRMRYVFLSLFVSMFFVVSIWLLSLEESVQNLKKSVPQSSSDERADSSKEEQPSLNSLLQKATPILPDSASDQSDYFNEQFRKDTQNTETEISTNP